MLKNFKNTLNQLYMIDSIEYRIEKLKNILKEKYHIDYLGVNVLNKDSTFLFSRLGKDEWHETCWKEGFVAQCPTLQKLSSLERDENGIMFFNTYLKKNIIDIRGEVFGEKKAGFSILLQNNENYARILFCITFTNDICLTTMNKKILFNLINDLYKATNILDPVLHHFNTIGNLNDISFINKKMYNFTLNI
jgi:hypothetical protein